MRTGPQTRGSTLMWNGLEKSTHKFYAGRVNPTRFLQAKCETDLCGTGQLALPPKVNNMCNTFMKISEYYTSYVNIIRCRKLFI